MVVFCVVICCSFGLQHQARKLFIPAIPSLEAKATGEPWDFDGGIGRGLGYLWDSCRVWF